jgi:hypothetical protein
MERRNCSTRGSPRSKVYGAKTSVVFCPRLDQLLIMMRSVPTLRFQIQEPENHRFRPCLPVRCRAQTARNGLSRARNVEERCFTSRKASNGAPENVACSGRMAERGFWIKAMRLVHS